MWVRGRILGIWQLYTNIMTKYEEGARQGFISALDRVAAIVSADGQANSQEISDSANAIRNYQGRLMEKLINIIPSSIYNTDTLCIWWTTPADCSFITEADIEALPDYVLKTYNHIDREDGGKLYTPDAINEILLHPHIVRIYPWPSTPIGSRLAKYIGIVMYIRDVNLLQTLPGIITDFKLRRI
jgi:hypothetical protein